MTQDRIRLRIGFLIVIAFAITTLLVMTFTAFWKLRPGEGIFFLCVGAGLTLLFFRKRLLALLGIVLSTVFVLAAMGAISHRSILGLVIALASASSAYLIARWDARKHPDRAFGDWKDLFENDRRSGKPGAHAD